MNFKMWQFVTAIAVVGLGWTLNVISLINMVVADSPITLLLLLKIVGIFAPPLGAILGYFFF